MKAVWRLSIALGLTLVILGGALLWAEVAPRKMALAEERRHVALAESAGVLRASDEITEVKAPVFLPLVISNYNPACEPLPGARYAALSVVNPHNPDAENDPGYNLGLLGYEVTDVYRGLVDYAGGEDPNAPQFPYLFGDLRVPNFPQVYRLHHGNGEPVTDWPVTMLGMEVSLTETLHVPESGYRIDPQGHQVMVIYASEARIAINYTRGDNLLGYTIYIEDVCVEPSLLALYRQLDAAGRTHLPALRGSEPFGRAMGAEIRLVVRDTGSAMDPRARKDWWRGR